MSNKANEAQDNYQEQRNRHWLEFLHQLEWLRAHPECDGMTDDEAFALYEQEQGKN